IRLWRGKPKIAFMPLGQLQDREGRTPHVFRRREDLAKRASSFADNGPGKCHTRLPKSGHRHLDVLDSDGDMMESLVAESADPFRNHAGPPAFAGIRLVDEHRRIAGLAIHLGIPILVRKSLAKTVAQLDELFRSFANVVRAEREMVDDREKAYPDLLQTHFEDLS